MTQNDLKWPWMTWNDLKYPFWGWKWPKNDLKMTKKDQKWPEIIRPKSDIPTKPTCTLFLYFSVRWSGNLGWKQNSVSFFWVSVMQQNVEFSCGYMLLISGSVLLLFWRWFWGLFLKLFSRWFALLWMIISSFLAVGMFCWWIWSDLKAYSGWLDFSSDFRLNSLE